MGFIKKIKLNKDKLKKIYKLNLKEDTINFISQEIINILTKEIKEENIIKKDINKILKIVKENFSTRKKSKKENNNNYNSKKEKNDSENKGTDKVFSDDEISKIIIQAKKTGKKELILSQLFFHLGLTLNEIANLKIENINKKENILKIKNKKIKVNKELIENILTFVKPKTEGNIFNLNGKKTEKKDLLSLIISLMENAGVKKRKNIESATQKYIQNLHNEGKAFMYWEHQDNIIELRNNEIKEKFKNI